MAALSIALLVAGVAGAVGRPLGLPAWAVPVLATAVDLVAGAASGTQAHRALDQLADPIAFLLATVPLAILLDRLGFFSAAAKGLTRGSGRSGGLWLLAAVVTTVLNLDASVVLLTPLYVRIARRTGADPLTLALQPLVLSWLASSALPVSNLTNLIAVSETGASATGFLVHLGLPSLAASLVGYACYRRLADRPAASLPSAAALAPQALDRAERRALVVGGAVAAAVLVGFVGGRSVGIEEWEVALAADVVLLGILRSVTVLPLRSIPLGTALVAASLGILATAAVTHLGVGRLLGGTGLLGLARTAAVSALGANVVNNLPALLVVLPALHHHAGPSLWAALLGVNMGPVLLVTGTLASLLWVETLGRLEVPVRRLDVTRVGLRVGLPGAGAGLVTLLALHAAGVG